MTNQDLEQDQRAGYLQQKMIAMALGASQDRHPSDCARSENTIMIIRVFGWLIVVQVHRGSTIVIADLKTSSLADQSSLDRPTLLR